MKRKRKLKINNYYKFIGSMILFILIIFFGIKIVISPFNKNISNNRINLEESTNSIVEISKDQEYKKPKHKKRESKAIPLTEGNKSDNSLPVLMYHYFFDDSTGETAPDSNFMPISSFEEQLKFLKENDFYYPTWDEVADFVDEKIDLPEKSVVLTMDDGDESVFNLALPLLEKYEIPATSFVITSWVEKSYLDNYQDSMLDLQSHTDNMHRGGGKIGHGGIFPSLPVEESTQDLKTSIEKLNGNNGALAYPFGDCNDAAKEATKRAGFKVAFTTENKRVKPGMDKYELPRVRMFSDISILGFEYSVT